MKRAAVVALALLALPSCIFGDSPKAGSEELSQFAGRISETTYAAIYRFRITGPLAPAVRTRLEIAQDPPVVIRKLETATADQEGNVVTLRSWQAHTTKGDFACTDYEKTGVRCVPNPVARGTFGSAQIDEFFDTPRSSDTFSSVRKATRRFRILGEQATCFEAVPVPPTAPPIRSPQPVVTPERFRYELCYADDGILLRGRRTILEDIEGESQRDALIEAVRVTRVVEPRDLRLPGPVARPEDLRG